MIRKVKKSDYEAISKLMMKAFKKPPWNETWNFQNAYQRIEQLDDGKYTRCYVYLLDDQIVGVLCGKLVTYVQSLDLMIEDFYIDPDCQRMGLGSKLMDAVIKELPEVDNFSLITGRDFYSVSFYQKNGFEVMESQVFMNKVLRNLNNNK